MTARTLTISISSATRINLQQSGYHLYAFRAVASSNKSGVPLVWGRVDAFLDTVSLTYMSEDLSAYISTDAIAVDAAITMGNETPVSLGDKVIVADGGGLTVAGGAPKDDVYIAGASGGSYTCGLAAALKQMPAQPFCAFILYPLVAVTVQPVDAIFVMWATSTYDPGVYMLQSLGPGLFVAFGDATQRTVSYDISQGWQSGDARWAKPVAFGTDLKTTLILDPGENHPTMR